MVITPRLGLERRQHLGGGGKELADGLVAALTGRLGFDQDALVGELISSPGEPFGAGPLDPGRGGRDVRGVKAPEVLGVLVVQLPVEGL
jgi:hypothetical protein